MNRATFYAGYDEGVIAGKAANQAEVLDLINNLMNCELFEFLEKQNPKDPDKNVENEYGHSLAVLNRLREIIEQKQGGVIYE